MIYKCPNHKSITLKKVEDYEGALICPLCPDIFTVIDGCLCILDGNRWKDVKTDEYKEVK